MITLFRSYVFFFALLSVATVMQGQALYDLSRPSSSLVSQPVTGEVAYFYETTHLIKEQTGAWNFRLGNLEAASVNLLREDGQYEQIILYKYFVDKIRLFSFLKFDYNEKQLLRTVNERNTLFSREDLFEYRYDKRGRPASMTFALNSVPFTETTYTLANKKQLTESMQMLSSKARAMINYSGGQVERYEFFDTSGVSSFQRSYTYDDQKRLIKNELRTANPKIANDLVTLEYLNDEHGNWVKLLEHHHASGRYKLVQRQIVYRNQLPEPATTASPVGQWNCPIYNYILKAEADGTFTLIDGNDREVTTGTWKTEGWGRYNFRRQSKGYFNKRGPFNNDSDLTVELSPGRLIMYNDDGDHYDFTAESVIPTDEVTLMVQKYMRWEESLWESPGKRAADAIPADIKMAFENTRAIAPNQFKACLGELCGVVDGDGAVLMPFAYADINLAIPGFYSIQQDGKGGLVDDTGQEILPVIYDRIWLEPKIGFTILGTRSQEGRYYFDMTTREFFPYEKENLRAFNDSRWVVRRERWTLLCDRDFNPIVQEGRYFDIKILNPNRYLALAPNRAYEIIDADGQLVKKLPGYRRITTKTFGYMEGETTEGDHLKALLDHDGNVLTEALYEQLSFAGGSQKVGDLAWELQIRNVIAKFKKPNGKEGYLTGLGEEK